ncbi:MAG: hypothetical protein COV08_00710 [Candidatus Vogelbacteria bacterium CG10_big_fil_rev_8_21_14_0_10_49_38]|uniref:DNA replication/recombination mediator RecO N-terminal domain-containing protein n=1 Tax=Candidatus Vogelbacteria bacterium CG10_big_fil_rev_8_21_14_0_10_49_38 TaxID=1975043 RepID=A0A2H0RIF3_9BACT|nr:MAG: hypothetical protein BK006_00720 [bacterium CG10_49_38]PIR46273.1 MAG: hypothetical protein COV08_00710 [Candidatus Vogelbacteria bacterium CG10_big_fil_rev_8_21_14_0_10_49_38]
MAYRHYETRGLVLGWRNFGEANRFYQILTPDFGLVRVAAQGVRQEKSKFRYQLNGFLIELVLIRGREYWRLVGAKTIGATANRAQINFNRRMGLVLSRLLQGEEAGHRIFDDLCLAWDWLGPGRGSLAVAEIFCLVRLLSELGYLAASDRTALILATPDFNRALVDKIEADRSNLISIINDSLAASGL